MLLSQVNIQQGTLFQSNRLLRHEDGHTGLIASAGTLIDSPSGVVLAIDGKVDGTGDTFLVGLIIVGGFEVTCRVAVVRKGFGELDRDGLFVFASG